MLLLDAHIKISIVFVHFVDECNPGHMMTVSLPPNGHSLSLHSSRTIENNYSSVQRSQSSLNLNGEVDMSRGINQIDLMVVPWK